MDLDTYMDIDDLCCRALTTAVNADISKRVQGTSITASIPDAVDKAIYWPVADRVRKDVNDRIRGSGS